MTLKMAGDSMLRGLFVQLLLAALYYCFGKIGVLLSVPPAYATMIWPASGIAVGMMIVFGWRVFLGVLLGSFVLHCEMLNVVFFESDAYDLVKVLSAFGIAVGASLQALVGYYLIDKFIGIPIYLNRVRDVLFLLFLAAPVACLFGAGFSVSVLYFAGILPFGQAWSEAASLWLSDVFGVIVFSPLVLIAPLGAQKVIWRGKALDIMPVFTLFLLIFPLGVTFYAWKVVSENQYMQGVSEFNALVTESEKALLFRMDSYNYSLLGGVGFFEGSSHVSADEWKVYVETVDVTNNFPGMRGIGFIQDIGGNDLRQYEDEVKKDGVAEYKIYPQTVGRPLYVIKYIEPVEQNKQALGLNIGFEDHRVEAANLSRDTGRAAITKRISLVQDEEKKSGFLLLHPMYKQDFAVGSVQERRDAFLGWIYAPFVAENFFKNLTRSQNKFFNIRVYDGDKEDPQALIYASHSAFDRHDAVFSMRRKIEIMQQTWFIVWESTAQYEHIENNQSAIYILVGGLAFTAVFGLFLLVVSIRQFEALSWLAEDRRFVLPSVIFLISSLFSYALYSEIRHKEVEYVYRVVEEEIKKIEELVSLQIDDKILAVRRMAQRWVAEGGTSEAVWQADAKNHVEQISGLKALEWIDEADRLRWVYPVQGDGKQVEENFVQGSEQKKALMVARENNHITVTQPLEVMQGFSAFMTYVPMKVGEQFQGFIAAIFSVDDFLNQAISNDLSEDFLVRLSYGGNVFYQTYILDDDLYHSISVKKFMKVHDKEWVLEIIPSNAFVSRQLSFLPSIIFIAGLLVSALIAVTVRYILLAGVKSNYLLQSNKLNEAILSNAEYLIIATDRNGKVILFNEAAEELLGYQASEVKDIHTMLLWHDQDEVAEHARKMSEELELPIEASFEVFTIKSEMGYVDTNEWTFIRKDGRRFPASLTVSPLRDGYGHTTGYLGIAEDISERMRQQKALEASEETFRSAMEHASIGMALVDLDGQFLLVNEALCKIVGYSDEELVTMNFQSITHTEDLGTDLENINQMMSGQIPNYQLEKRYIRKDGVPVWVNISVSVARNDDGSPKNFISQIQDITERKEVERIKNEFISVVSHELRTPLTSIRGSLGLIEGTMSKDMPEKALNLIKIAYKNSERLIFLINDILDLDKIAAGKMRFDMQVHGLVDLIGTGLESNKAYADKFNVTVVRDLIAQDVQIKVDVGRWQQVFSNLLSNAIKFSPEGDHVEVYCVHQNKKIRICIKDHGSGIPEDFKSRIFSKFSQADSTNTRTKGGTGLGLSISKEIVIRMGGAIGFESEAGQGSVFWFEFPVVNEISNGGVGEVDLSDLPYILHVEDDADLSHVIASSLSDIAVIKTATTLVSAQDMLREYPFSIVIIDIGLPDGSGLSFLDYIEENLSSALPVIIILAAEEAPPSVRQKVSECLVKSTVSETKIIETIQSYIHADKRRK